MSACDDEEELAAAVDDDAAIILALVDVCTILELLNCGVLFDVERLVRADCMGEFELKMRSS